MAVTLLVLVASAVPGMRPALALTERNMRIYVPNPETDTVTVLDADTNGVIATVAVGDRPTTVLSAGTERVYVVNELSGTVSVIDIATNAVVATVPVGLRPADGHFSVYYGELWIANQGSGTVSVINLNTNTVIDTIPVGPGPRAVTFSAHGEQIYVTSSDSTVSVIDEYDHDWVASIPVGQTPVALIAPFYANDRLYVVNQGSNTVSVVHRASNTVVKTIPVGLGPVSIVVVDVDKLAVANQGSNTVSIIDMDTDTVVETRPATPADFDDGRAVVFVPPPVIAGQTWYSTGAKAHTAPAGATVSLYAVGALEGVPYVLTLSRPSDWPCLHRVALLNPTTVMAGPSGLIGRVRGTIPPGTPAGNYTVCFRHTGGVTATGLVTLTVT